MPTAGADEEGQGATEGAGGGCGGARGQGRGRRRPRGAQLRVRRSARQPRPGREDHAFRRTRTTGRGEISYDTDKV